MKNIVWIVGALLFLTSCSEKYRKIDKDDVTVGSERLDTILPEPKTQTEIREDLLKKGYQIFDVIDEKTKDTIIMQQYFIAFLKNGPNKIQNEEESKRLLKAHLAHLKNMYDLGYADISGPFGDIGDLSGITIYNVPTLKMADSLANADPMVKQGSLVIEIHPWWAPKGYSLR
ncbi:YciI family protein [Gelidibacter sp.]|uniref:YciI family protein n=1 Tax=Gelidibacter sp. TaxID=2018083 RepID=UPI002C1B1A3F|nr:YciI family protein [Gelidibacter sp.]HUH28285.1 YciI family protein [Gelidibacter sp.]